MVDNEKQVCFPVRHGCSLAPVQTSEQSVSTMVNKSNNEIHENTDESIHEEKESNQGEPPEYFYSSTLLYVLQTWYFPRSILY